MTTEKKYNLITSYSLQLLKEREVSYPVETVNNYLQGADAMREYLQYRDCEHMAVLLLDSSSAMIGISIVAIGGMSGIKTSIRDIFKFAIVGRASGFILGHNHPSGDVHPSREDIEFTKLTQVAADLMGIPLMDHLIVSSGNNSDVFSFNEHNLIGK